jgi:hypothetical protein
MRAARESRRRVSYTQLPPKVPSLTTQTKTLDLAEFRRAQPPVVHMPTRARSSCHPFRPARSSPPRVSFWHTCSRASMNLSSLLSARTHASKHAGTDALASDPVLPCLALKLFDVLSEPELCLDLDVTVSLPCFLCTTTLHRSPSS